ncbi:hypothetical protein DFP72DRAFT_604838 [Ephemerocybe angulata]|uniref:Uncharacterized protein n=1 Tax=Ephemerocybe angulata TaxID=980116 RepID=A0A8H6HKN7_9AGAR|nr:hypothetical protein DFP72DRAFT_604838 [Tulosesus angulatus]
MIRTWLFQSCWPMGYSAYDQSRLSTLNSRILHAVQKLDEWNKNETANPTSSLQSASDMAFTSVNVMPTPMTGHVTPLAAMGGGDLLAEEGDREGWRTSWEQGGSRGWNSGKPSRSNSGNHDSPPAQGGFVPPPIHDPYDYSVVRPADDAAARKARKKAKSRSKSASAPSEPPFIPLSYKSPHPPYHSPAYHSPSYNSPAHMSRATSPWLRPPTDKEVTGLLSLRDLDSALGELLPAPYRSMHQVDPALEEARSWRRGLEKKTKKKSSKDKKKKEKEKERKRERERSRTSKWAWDYRYSPTQEANSGGVSDSDGDDSSDDSDSESSDDGKGNSDPRRKSWTGQSNQYGQPNDANPQPPPLYSYNPYQQYGAGPSTGGQAQSYPPPSSSSYPQYAPHTEPVSERKPPPPPLTLSPISRPQDIPHTQHLSTYPGMIVPGQVPGAMNLTMPLQAPSVPHAAPPPSQYSYQGASVAPVRQASGSSSRPSPKDDEGPFIPPMLTGEDMYRYSPHQQQSQLEQQSQLYDSQNRHRQSSLSQSQLLQVQASHRPTSSMANGNPYGRY